MPYSTACNTPLSNFESGLDYRDVADPAIMARTLLRNAHPHIARADARHRRATYPRCRSPLWAMRTAPRWCAALGVA